MSSERKRPETFFGWHVVVGAFVLAFFGWGMGFYAPPIFLSVLHDRESWPVSLISAAITTHFLVGAIAASNLPALYRRHGALAPTRAGALCLALGTVGWAVASAPWHLLVAATLSGMGWAAMGAVVNCIVSPWFVRKRPRALAFAYNGGTVGGMIFSPAWVAAISVLGFAPAAIAISCVAVVTLWILSGRLLSRTPHDMGLTPDGAGRQETAEPWPGATAGNRRPSRSRTRAGKLLGRFTMTRRAAFLTQRQAYGRGGTVD